VKAGNDWTLTAIRRTRVGGEMRDLVDASLSEVSELYDLEILDILGNVVRTVSNLTSPTFTYTEAQQQTDFGTPLTTYPASVLDTRWYQLSGDVGRGFARSTRHDVRRNSDTDPDISSVVLLTGLDAATPLDRSPSAHVLTPGAGATLDTAVAKFTNSFDFDGGTSAVITTPDHADWDIGQVWTLEGWTYWASIPASGLVQTFLNHDNTTGNQESWQFQWAPATNELRLTISTNGSSTALDLRAAWTPVAGTWYHVAVTRDSSDDIRFFVDGIQVGTTFNSASLPFASTADMRLGNTQPTNTVRAHDGNMDEWRITKGVARYTQNFPPPVAPFSDL